MASSITECRDHLVGLLKTIPDVRVYTDPGASIAPPGIIVQNPQLDWSGSPTGEPTNAVFTIVYAVKMSERSADLLLDAIPLVSEAIADDPDMVILSASPGLWNSNGTDLPAYTFQISIS